MGYITQMLKTYLKEAQGHTLFSGESPFRVHLSAGADESRVAILAGPNASGKSLLVRLLASRLNQDKVEPVQVSMRYRTSAGIHRAFMFGSDEDQSTGATSLYAVTGALACSRGRGSPHWLMLDEPDIGLAEEYAEALGCYFAEYANALPEKAHGFVLVTHSRRMVAAFANALALRPHFMHLERPASLDEWLAAPGSRTVEELLGLEQLGNQRFSAVERIIRKAHQKKRGASA